MKIAIKMPCITIFMVKAIILANFSEPAIGATIDATMTNHALKMKGNVAAAKREVPMPPPPPIRKNRMGMEEKKETKAPEYVAVSLKPNTATGAKVFLTINGGKGEKKTLTAFEKVAQKALSHRLKIAKAAADFAKLSPKDQAIKLAKKARNASQKARKAKRVAGNAKAQVRRDREDHSDTDSASGAHRSRHRTRREPSPIRTPVQDFPKTQSSFASEHSPTFVPQPSTSPISPPGENIKDFLTPDQAEKVVAAAGSLMTCIGPDRIKKDEVSRICAQILLISTSSA